MRDYIYMNSTTVWSLICCVMA